MRHRVYGRTLNRSTSHRRAMFRNMAIALFTHGQITTTVAKAKAVKPLIEKLITAAKRGDLAARRRVIKVLGDPIFVDRDLKDFTRRDLEADGYKVNRYHELQDGPRLVKRLFEEIAPRYADRTGGYTRIIKLASHRIGDGTQLCVLQLVGDEEGPQVSGQFSRRREKANRRMDFAAKVRKGAKQEAPAETVAEAAPEAPAESAADDTATEQSEPEVKE